MNIKSKELVDLIIDKDANGIREFVQILRDKIKDKLANDGKDVYELSMNIHLDYKTLSNYIHGGIDNEIPFDNLFKLVKYLNK